MVACLVERLAALRTLRAVLVIPSLFALTYEGFGNLQMALFAAFGGFANLIFASFGRQQAGQGHRPPQAGRDRQPRAGSSARR